MASSGISTLTIQGIEPEEVEDMTQRVSTSFQTFLWDLDRLTSYFQIRMWIQDSSTPLDFISPIDPIGRDYALLIAPFWDTMAKCLSKIGLADRITTRTRLLN